MIISPPFLRNKQATQSEADWIDAMMPVSSRRGYPLNTLDSWHGGIHIPHTDPGNSSEKVRAIADGTVVSFRMPSEPWKRDQLPLKYSPVRGTDDGYVLLKHETEIGAGENGKVVFYSLYMHLKHLEKEIKTDAKIYRKAPLGSSGMADGQNEFHFQVFCDDENISKLTGRKTRKLDVSSDGRTDAVYGDIHFYLPAGTKFYDRAPENNGTSTNGLAECHTSSAPLYVSMTLAKGNCSMVTRQENTQTDGQFELLGEPLVNADGADYEYNLYKTAMRNYRESPSAGFELLRFGRVINTEHETLVPANAPLWMTVSYPGGKGVVNLAEPGIKKFSDADFPHWTGWQLVDDDKNPSSQCNSAIIRKLQAEDRYAAQSSRLICYFPFEWEKSTIDARYTWLMTGLPWEQCTLDNRATWRMAGTGESKDRVLMSKEDYDKFKQHAEALCFDSGVLGRGKVWHFDPRGFIEHSRKCNWVDSESIKKIMIADTTSKNTLKEITDKSLDCYSVINIIMRKYNIIKSNRISHFLGQGAVESGCLLSMQEVSQVQITKKDGSHIGGKIVDASKKNENTELGHWYGSLDSEIDEYFSGKKYNSKGALIAGSYSWKNGNCGDVDAQKFRGRGFKMLTGLDTYSSYWVYRGWLSKDEFDQYWWDDPEYAKKNVRKMKKRAPIINSPHKITEKNNYNCIDTGGFFITCFKGTVLKIMDADMGMDTIGGTDNAVSEAIAKVTSAINGGDKGIAQRKKFTKKAKKVFDDAIY